MYCSLIRFKNNYAGSSWIAAWLKNQKHFPAEYCSGWNQSTQWGDPIFADNLNNPLCEGSMADSCKEYLQID